MADINFLKQSMSDLEEDAVLEMLKEFIQEGRAEEALTACQDGIRDVGDRFESGEYFVGDLIFAGEIMTESIEILKPALRSENATGKGKMILCTVKGDLHDIGKNIVKSMLEASGFDVIDLGIDVDSDKIIETANAQGIKIVALSGVLTLALGSMREIVEELRKVYSAGDLKIIIGGNPVTAEACKVIGADEWAKSPQKTVDVCTAWAAG